MISTILLGLFVGIVWFVAEAVKFILNAGALMLLIGFVCLIGYLVTWAGALLRKLNLRD